MMMMDEMIMMDGDHNIIMGIFCCCSLC